MNIRLFSLLLVLLLAIPSCTFRRSNPRLMEIERKLDSFPEEMWQRLNTPEVMGSLSSRAERMYCALLRAEAMNKTMRYMDTLHFDEVNDYFQRYGDANYRMRSLYIKGCIYRDKGDAPMAIQYYRDAVNSVDTASADCDFLSLSRIYGQMALLYDMQCHPRKEIETWRIAAHFADLAHDTISSIQFRQYMAYAYAMLRKPDSVEYYMADAFASFKKLGIRKYIAAAQAYKLEGLIRGGDLKQAKKLIDEYIANSGLIDSSGRIHPSCVNFLYQAGNYYTANGQYDSAIYYYRQCGTYDQDILNTEMCYSGLLNLYIETRQTDSIIKYALLSMNVKDSSNVCHTADEVVRMEAAYNYAEHHRIAVEKTQEAERMWRMLLISLAFIAVGTVMAWRVYRRSRQRQRTMEEERKRAMAEYAHLCEQLQTAEEELYSSKHNHEAFLAEKEDEIARLKMKLKESGIVRLASEKGEEALLNLEVVKRLHRTYMDSTEITEDEWHELQEAMREFVPAFYNTAVMLRQYLTNQEFMLVMLTRCHFSLYEIRTLMNTSAQRFTNLRTSVNRKLFDGQGARTLTQHIMDMPESLKV